MVKLDFRHCKTAEDVDEVFRQNKEELKIMQQINKLSEVQENRSEYYCNICDKKIILEDTRSKKCPDCSANLEYRGVYE